MKEILYIARLDARPWIKSSAGDSLIPFILLFTAVEILRVILGQEPKLSEFSKYFVVVVAVVIIVHLGKLIPACWKWRGKYTTKFLHDAVYAALISTALFNAIATFYPIRWSMLVDPLGMVPDAIVRVAIVCGLSSLGVIYLWLQTRTHQNKENSGDRGDSKYGLLGKLRAKEANLLPKVYLLHFVLSSVLLSFLILRGA